MIARKSAQINFALLLIVFGRVFAVIILLPRTGVFIEETKIGAASSDIVRDIDADFRGVAEAGEIFVALRVAVVTTDQ